MIPLSFSFYFREFFPRIPVEHWIVMVLLSLFLSIFLYFRKKYTVYESVAIGLLSMTALFFFEAAIVIRLGNNNMLYSGIDLMTEYQKLLQRDKGDSYLFLFNLAVFVPFGFFLAEFMAEKELGVKPRIVYGTMVAFGFSLCIECLQLILKVGYFEVMDLVMNTTGAFAGIFFSIIGRMLFYKRSNAKNSCRKGEKH